MHDEASLLKPFDTIRTTEDISPHLHTVTGFESGCVECEISNFFLLFMCLSSVVGWSVGGGKAFLVFAPANTNAN